MYKIVLTKFEKLKESHMMYSRIIKAEYLKNSMSLHQEIGTVHQTSDHCSKHYKSEQN